MFKKIIFVIVSFVVIFSTLMLSCFADSYTVEELSSLVKPVYGLSGLSYNLKTHSSATQEDSLIRLDTLSDSYIVLGDDDSSESADIHPTWIYTEHNPTGQVYANYATFNTFIREHISDPGIGDFYGYSSVFFTSDTELIDIRSDRYLTVAGQASPSITLYLDTSNYNSNQFVVYYSLDVLHYYDDNGTIRIGSTHVQYYKRVAPARILPPKPFMGGMYADITIDLPSFDNIQERVSTDSGYDYTFGDYYVFDNVVVSFSANPHIEDGFIVENGTYSLNTNDRYAIDNYIYTSLDHEAIMEDFSFTDWIANVVGSLFNVQIAPGISLGVILGFCLVVGLLFVFLRYFAGG